MKDNMITQTPSLIPNTCQKQLIDRKYGMFIHYGINTFNDTEWSDGKLPVSSYDLKSIDVESWVKNAYLCGMNYVIIITKHHDGFCLWDTDTTDYSVNYSSNKTDIVMEAYKACQKYGLKLGLYYSLWDRHEKCYKDDEKYVNYMLTQLEELVNGKYGEICEFWFDGGWDKRNNRWGVDRIYDLIKSYQPDCAISVNVTIGRFNSKGGGKKKYFPENYKENMPMKYFPSDFRLLDPHCTPVIDPKIYKYKKEKYFLPFEATICIRDMTNWFWDPKYTTDKLLTKEFIIEKYKHFTGQDNVLVVNVAPNIYGVQEDSDIERLLEVADDLKIRREPISSDVTEKK